MSKIMAVSMAVGHQLVADKRWPPNDITAVMADDYHYATPTMLTFLNGVQATLQAGTPAYAFAYDIAFANTALGQTVKDLTVSINKKTA